MEFDGTEKRIQALFSELSLEDHRRTPRFERLWTPREHTTKAPVFKRSFAVSALAVLIVAVTFALWSTRSESALNIAPLGLPTLASPQLAVVVVESPRVTHPRQKRITRPRQPESLAISEATLLSRWQSPTQNFMQSPSSVSFNSLPQLDQSAKDLESFLPKKESNQ